MCWNIWPGNFRFIFFLGYFRVILCISGYFRVYWISSLFGGSEPYIEVFFFHLLRVFFEGAANHYPRLSWCYTWITQSCLGKLKISGNTRKFRLSATHWFSKLSRAWSGIEKIPGIRSGWGTRWALVLLRETLICPPFWRLPPRPRSPCWQKLQRCRSPPLSLSLCCWGRECQVKSWL